MFQCSRVREPEFRAIGCQELLPMGSVASWLWALQPFPKNRDTSQEHRMRRIKPQPLRNKIDLADPAQSRVWTKRLGISAEGLQRMIGKVGNSVAAVAKEIELQKAPPPKPSLPAQIDPVPLPAVEAVLAEVQLTDAPASLTGPET
jgi:Protein of unknown function (DUF3606)